MKQHLKTKLLNEKILKLSPNNKFLIYMSSLHVNEAIKKKKLHKKYILSFKFSYMYCKFLIIITLYI